MRFAIDMLTRGIDYERFHRAYFSDAFSQELVRTADLVERSLRERVALPDGKERICLYIVPRVKLPAWAIKLAGGYSFGYLEETVFDAAARGARSVVRTPGHDLLRVSAETAFRESAFGVHTRIELDVQARLPGVSGMIERFAARETTARYRIVERTLQTFVDEGRDHSAPLAAP